MARTRCLFLSLVFLASQTELTRSETDPEKDPQMADRVNEAESLVVKKQPAEAIRKCDEVIAAFKAKYANRKEEVYCARSSAESLAYLMTAAAEADKGTAKKTGAVVLSPVWAQAYFLKGFALEDLNRLSQAKATLGAARELSPWSPLIHIEMGTINQREKNWPKALQEFKDAENHNSICPDDSKATELGRARRGVAYVLVEQGKLDEAAKKYEECLKGDPSDERAVRELQYVRGLQAKSR